MTQKLKLLTITRQSSVLNHVRKYNRCLLVTGAPCEFTHIFKQVSHRVEWYNTPCQFSSHSTTMSATTDKPITLYTAGTPNGHPVSVILEELKAVNPAVDYK